MVLTHHRKVQPTLPPTTLILKDETNSNNNTRSQSGFNQNNTLMNKKNLTNNFFGGTASTSTMKNFVSSATGTNNEGGTQTEPTAFMPKPPKPVPANAANNLMKALKEQNEASSSGHTEVDVFLESAGLPKYREIFIDNGVEDLETILELDEKHLEQMGVPMGHKLKLVKRIKEIRTEKGMYVPPSR